MEESIAQPRAPSLDPPPTWAAHTELGAWELELVVSHLQLPLWPLPCVRAEHLGRQQRGRTADAAKSGCDDARGLPSLAPCPQQELEVVWPS